MGDLFTQFALLRRAIAPALLFASLLHAPSLLALGKPTPETFQEGLTHRIWRVQDGLPDGVINAVAETLDHYLWLGSPRELIRFDGFHFTDLSTEIAPAIRDFGVTCLFAASDGSLWIGTGDGKLLRVKRNVIETYGTESGLRAYDVRVLQQDARGVIWAGTDHGIYRFVDGHFERIPHIGDPSVHAMTADGGGGFWMGGSHLFHYARGVFVDVALPKQKVPERIEALARTPDGTLWIGTLGGLLFMDAQGRILPETSVSRQVKALAVDRGSRLWVGTLDSGLYLRLQDNSFAQVPEATSGLSSTVFSLLPDESGDVWLGTHSGLVRLSNTGIHLTSIPASRDALRVSVALDTDGSLWIGAGKVFHLTHGKVNAATLPLVGDFPVSAILRAGDGALWIGTAGGGAIRIPPNGKPERYAAKIGTSYITGFMQGKQRDVWIATEGGIAVWRKGDMASFQHIEGAPHQPVLSMAVAEPEGVWIGTSHGLLRLRNGQFVSDPAITALGSHAVRALYSSVDGALWIGTESGLWRWKDRRMAQVPLEEDAGSPAVLSILEDSLGRLWLGGPDRVRRVQQATVDRILDSPAGVPAPASARAGHASDVVIPEDFNVLEEAGVELFGGMPSSSAPDAHSGAWYASDAGPVHINGDTKEPPRVPLTVVLDQIVVDGRRLAVPQSSLSLSPSTKTIEIEATPVVLGSQAGLQMRRKLIGFDRSWTAEPISREATYTNLPPGEYVYRVEASWGDWDKASTVELHIVQKAHFYRQWWFLVLCTILTLMVIWLLHRLKLHRVAAQFSAVAEERNRIAREMHDTILQGCIGISFLLDGIASSEQMQQAEDSPQPALHEPSWAALKLARSEIERTIHEARAAIWNLRRTQDEAQLDRSLRELFDKMTGKLPVPAKFQTSGPSLQLTRDQQWEILMSAREAMRNAIHHAGGTTISVSLHYMADLVRVEIADEGCGISQAPDAARSSGHYGVVGMQERMAKIGGTCTISSAKGTGTTVTLEIPVETIQPRSAEAK